MKIPSVNPIRVTCLVICAFLLLAPLTATAQRSFYMGLTPWPPDFTDEGVRDVYRFISEHGDMVAHHFDGGVPWLEALERRAYSQHLQDDWRRRKSNSPPNHAVYVAITPLNFARNGLADYWGKSDGMSLPKEWAKKRLNDPDVERAFLNYAESVIEYFSPQFLAVGIEGNVMISKKPEKWDEYVDLNRRIYSELKRRHPRLPIFATIQYEHLRGIEKESKKNLHRQMPGVRELLQDSDLAGLSTYHYAISHNPPRDDYFEPALSLGKPICIVESGAVSRDFKIFWTRLKGNPEDQDAFVSFLLEQATQLRFVFVINYIAIDYDRMLPKLPWGIREIAKAWAYTGLQDADGRPKPALRTWDSYLRKRR